MRFHFKIGDVIAQSLSLSFILSLERRHMDTDLEKLRRFCIAVALVLITYELADISISSNAEVKIFDVPFTVKRSDLLPIGIVMASLFGMIRFIYYGHMIGPSPYRKRRDDR